MLGRRGPHQIAMTPKELGELGHLEDAVPRVDLADFPPVLDDALLEPGQRKSVTHLRDFAELERGQGARRIVFDFFARPVADRGRRQGRAADRREDQARRARARAVGTGETYAIDCGMVVTCIGYKTPPIEGVPYEEDRGRFANADGVIGGGLYCVGWARRGPTGTIGTNRPDGYEVAEKIAADLGRGGGRKAGRRRARPAARRPRRRHRHLPRLAADRGGRGGARPRRSPREKFVAIEEMLGARGR